jgi:hypothetical protein
VHNQYTQFSLSSDSLLSKEKNVPFHERPPFCEEVLVLKMEALLKMHSIRYSAKKCGCFFYAPAAAAVPFGLIE